MAYGIAAIAVAIIVVGAAILAVPASQQSTNTTGFNGQTGTQIGGTVPMIIQLTDPPNVPNGTQSLNLTYSSISIHVTGESGPASWINSNASGEVNLLSLVNVSKTLTVIQVPKDSSINMIKFNMSSVSIDVNGTSYPVSTSNSILTVPLIGGDRVQNLSATLLQLNPTVHEIIANNTSISFFLVPSATGIVKNTGVNQNETQVGSEHHLNQTEVEDLDNARGNVSISSVTLSTSGNITVLNLTLTNNGNVSVTLSAISLHGIFNSTGLFSSTSSCSSNVESTSSSNSGDYASNSSSTREQGDHESQLSNLTSTTETSNETTATTTTTSMPVPEYDSHNNHSSDGCGVENHAINDLPHEVVYAANGTQLIVLSGEDATDRQVNATPVVLAPGQSETFTFNGIISFSFGDQNNHTLYLVPIVGSMYGVQADMSNDVHVMVGVNATS